MSFANQQTKREIAALLLECVEAGRDLREVAENVGLSLAEVCEAAETAAYVQSCEAGRARFLAQYEVDKYPKNK